jgi:GNAT superfamily N-acetyltransferase
VDVKLRPARTVDAFALAAMLERQHARSRFQSLCQVDAPYTRKLMAQAIQRHAGTNDGATLVNVVEANGEIAAFCVGILTRVYHIGTALAAQDMFLVSDADAPALAPRRLLAAFLTWAQTNPRVVEVNLSHTDALPEGDRMGRVYERMGFERCGGIYRRANPAFLPKVTK